MVGAEGFGRDRADLLEDPGVGELFGIFVVVAVDVAQDDEEVRAGVVGDVGGELVVVAEDLLGGGRNVVFVDDRDDLVGEEGVDDLGEDGGPFA